MSVFYFDAEIITQRGKSSAEARARRIEFPRALITINFAEDNSRFDGKIFQRERRNFSARAKNFQSRAANVIRTKTPYFLKEPRPFSKAE